MKSAHRQNSQGDELKWTCALAVRDTQEEYDFLKKALPSAFRLKPSEIIIGIDEIDGRVSERLVNRIRDLCERHGYHNLRMLPVPKTRDWNFQLAHVIWEIYGAATYDKILSFDVDSTLTESVLLGLQEVGRNDIAVLSFTKRLMIKNVSDLIRHFFYRLHVRRSDYVFSGVYWVYRPYFFDTVDQMKYKAIYNGIDTFLTAEVMKQGKLRIVTRKEIGVKCMTPQNNDLPWRQFQTGVWIGANHIKVALRKAAKKDSLRERLAEITRDNNKRMASALAKTVAKSMVKKVLLVLISKRLHTNNPAVDRNVAFSVYLASLMYQQPLLFKGFKFAVENPENEIVRKAASMDENEWGYQGSRLIKDIYQGEMRGTGVA